jgi:hypothetical protein
VKLWFLLSKLFGVRVGVVKCHLIKCKEIICNCSDWNSADYMDSTVARGGAC